MAVHHIGYVVRDIAAYAASLPGLELEATAEDPIQRASLAIYRVGGASRIELIQPHDSKSFTWSHLERVGEGLHHICYEGIAADAIEAILRQHRLVKVRGPVHAVLFDRPVIFAVTRQRAIVEFIL
jgi:methylmalonyl-CoA/ethylmalonyl-CoA epimerase